MTDCKPCSSPVDTQAKLSVDLGDPVADPTAYRSLAGALQYLTFTRPDLTYAVQQVCLHMHDLRESHLAAVKRLLCYIRGTVGFGLVLHRSPTSELVVYTDADWGRLGRLSGHSPLHFRLRHLPGGQPCLLVVQAAAGCLPLQC